MVTIRFLDPSGKVEEVEAREGQSAMEAAIASGIEGIEAQCGGACSCATCHVYVADAWTARIGEAGELEKDMLEFSTVEIRETSRLSCQIKITPDLDGLELEVAS